MDMKLEGERKLKMEMSVGKKCQKIFERAYEEHDKAW